MARQKEKRGFHPVKWIKGLVARIGTLNLILILVGAFFLWFNAQMLNIFQMCGSIPESYACAVIAATLGECGICGWIRTTKDKRQDRTWQKQDEAEMKAEMKADRKNAPGITQELLNPYNENETEEKNNE